MANRVNAFSQESCGRLIIGLVISALSVLVVPAATAAMTPPGNALTFDGTTNYVDLGTDSSLALTSGAFTIEAWIKPTSKADISTILGRKTGGSANPGYVFYINSWHTNDGRLKFETQSATRATDNPVITWDVWQHVAATWDGGTLRFYVNGVEQAASGTVNLTDGSVHAMLGAFPSNGAGYDYSGTMDEVRIWNTTRSQNDIRDAMHHVLTGSESGLVAYYQFDESSGTSLPDLKTTNPGTLVNMTDANWVASTVPMANTIASRTNLRGVWIANVTSLASSRMSVANSSVSGTDFAVFGHDNGTNGWQVTDVPAGVTERLTRVWQAEVSGSASGTITIDTTGLSDIDNGSTLRLLVDADGTFSNATVVTGTFSAPNFAVSGQAISNGSYYTLGNAPFSEQVAIALPAVSYSWHGVAWGDYDNDGWIDFVISGDTAGGKITSIYHNNGDGTFTDINAGLPGVMRGAAAWGDFDGDGLLDLALSGDTGSGYITRVYGNNGDGTFTDINAGLVGAYYSSVAWGDYDNDGRPDLLLAGTDSTSNFVRIYRNNGDGTFSDSGVVLPGIGQGQAAWGDYDNDGRLDIVLLGISAGIDITRIYRNNGPDGLGNYTFTDINAGLTGAEKGGAAWGDYNNDGWLDLLTSSDTDYWRVRSSQA